MRLPSLLLLALPLAACGGSAPPPSSSPEGAALFQREACVTCHARGGEGSMLGPSLLGAREHWTHADLVAYLAEPQSFVEKSDRLRAQMAKYPARMQPYKHLSEAERGLLAEHVLSLGAGGG